MVFAKRIPRLILVGASAIATGPCQTSLGYSLVSQSILRKIAAPRSCRFVPRMHQVAATSDILFLGKSPALWILSAPPMQRLGLSLIVALSPRRGSVASLCSTLGRPECWSRKMLGRRKICGARSVARFCHVGAACQRNSVRLTVQFCATTNTQPSLVVRACVVPSQAMFQPCFLAGTIFTRFTSLMYHTRPSGPAGTRVIGELTLSRCPSRGAAAIFPHPAVTGISVQFICFI